jgi:hypothetical protein
MLVVAASSSPACAERELTSDRPDVTESPFTIEPGRVQLESSLVEHLRDHDETSRRHEWSAATINLRIGLGGSSEVQLLVDPWQRRVVRDMAGGGTRTATGVGDVTVRGKWNLRGNDDGDVAVALLPFVTLPTASAGLGAAGVDGGIALPATFSLPGDWDLGLMTEVDVERRDEGGRDLSWLNTVTIGHSLHGALAGYAELTAETGTPEHRYGFDVGLTLAASPELQLDVGGNFGLNGAAEDRLLFAGFVRRV